MTTNPNPWATPADQDGPRAEASSPTEPGNQGVVWEAYRQSVTELAQAHAAALQESANTKAETEAAVARAQAAVNQTRADRAKVEEQTGPFEAEVTRILADAGVSPDGAGSGSAELPVQTTRQALTAMDGLIDQLQQTSTELDAARRHRAAATARWTAIGVILAATVVTIGALALLGAPAYVQAAGAVVTFCGAWPTRTRGWVTAAIIGGITTGALVAVVALTGQVLSAILLLLGAVVAVLLTARAGIVQATRVTPTGGPPGPGR